MAFDTIENIRDIDNGPKAGEYHTKDLDDCYCSFVLDNNRLYRKLVTYESVPEDERKHPILDVFRAKFVGLKDTNFHGTIEVYNVNETWKLSFSDGDLVSSTRIEYIETKLQNSKFVDDANDWSGDDKEYEFDPEEYEG